MLEKIHAKVRWSLSLNLQSLSDSFYYLYEVAEHVGLLAEIIFSGTSYSWPWSPDIQLAIRPTHRPHPHLHAQGNHWSYGCHMLWFYFVLASKWGLGEGFWGKQSFLSPSPDCEYVPCVWTIPWHRGVSCLLAKDSSFLGESIPYSGKPVNILLLLECMWYMAPGQPH